MGQIMRGYGVGRFGVVVVGGGVGGRVRRGAALLIVMVVVGVAAVLGYAMVSASALQAQTAGNLQYATGAEYLAESGAQLALHYLQKPSASPVAMPSGYYPGQTGITFGTSVKGSADVSVAYDAGTKLYTITSVGKATTSTGSTVSKTLVAKAAIVRHYTQTSAVQSTSNIRVHPQGTVIGELQTNGQLNTVSPGKVQGVGRARSFTGLGTVTTKITLTAAETVTAPTLPTIKDYHLQYEYNGRTYTPQKLTTDQLSNVTLSGDATNPGGVYWYNGSVLLKGNVTINGTLFLTKGSLYAANTNNVITPKVGASLAGQPPAGLPAVVVPGNVVMVPEGTLTVNGLLWTGGGIKTYTSSGSSDPDASSGLLNAVGDLLGALLALLGLGTPPPPGMLEVNGAYVSAGATPIELTYKGPLKVTYDAAKVAVPDFSTTNAVTMGVRVVEWQMN